MDLFTLGINLNTSKLKAGESDMKSFTKTTSKAETQTKDFGKSTESAGLKTSKLSSAVKAATVALAAYVTVDAAASALKTADSFQLMNDRIRLATDSTGDFNSVQKQLFELSQNTGTALQGNVELFDRIRIGAQELGRSNTDVLQLVDALNKLGSTGGTSAEAMSNATLQLSQSLAGGVLRAEEFNSIVENTPKIAQAIAEGLDTSIGGLRQMVLDGRVLSDDVFEALLSQTNKINEDFEKMPVRLGRATQTLGNSFTLLIGGIDNALGASENIAYVIDRIGRGMGVWAEQTFDVASATESVVTQVTRLSDAYRGVDRAQLEARESQLARMESDLAMKVAEIENNIISLPLDDVIRQNYQNVKKELDEVRSKIGEIKEETTGGLNGQKSAVQQLIDQYNPLIAKERELMEDSLALNLALETAGKDDVPRIEAALEAVRKKLKEVREEQKGGIIDSSDDFDSMLANMKIKSADIGEVFTNAELGYMQYYQARADAEDELNQQIIDNADAEKRRLEELIGMANSIASSFGSGLVTGDFSGASGALSNLVQSQAETGISGALASSLGATTAGIFGAAGGGIAGAIASNILSGKQEISRAFTIALKDGAAQVSTDIKFGSIFGSSTSSLKFNSADNELANNSINSVLKNLAKTFKEIGVTVDNFSGSFTGDTFAGAIENMAEQFINGGFESIDAFRDLGQSTEDALAEFVTKIKTISESVRSVAGTDLDESIGQFIDQRAQAIDTNAEKAVDFWQSYLRVIDDITNGATEPLETGEQYLNAFATASAQLTNEYGGSITRLRKDIAFIEQNQLSEAIGRLGEGDLVAYGQFAESLADLVKDGDVTAAFDALNSVIATDTQTYAEIITNAREDLEGLGFDGNISAENFAKQYSDALANGIDEGVLANYLNAGVLLKNIGDATESLNDEAKETADNLLSLESRLQTALGNDDAATLIDRQIELANAASPAAAALLELIYDAEDAEIAFNNSAEALERLSDAQMNATDTALSSLSRLTQEQQEILRDAYDDNVDAAKDAITDLSDSIGDLESVAESLKNAIGETVDVSATVARLQLSSARQQIAAFAASGVLPDADTLEDLLNRVTGDTAQYYATAEDYYREQGRTANDLAMLSELADDQLSEAERSLKAQEDQVDLLKDQYDLASEALDDQLQAAYDQVSILRNTYDTTTTIAEALDNILIAMNAEEAGTSAFTATEIKGAAESIFGNITSAGGSEDDAYRAIAEEAIRNGVSGNELAMALGVPLSTVQDITSRLNIPGFANGGINAPGGLSMTGERGMEIVNMPAGSHTTNANETKRLLDNSGVEALLSELLNKAASSNLKIKQTYDILNRVTEGGNAVNTNSVIVGDLTGA